VVAVPSVLVTITVTDPKAVFAGATASSCVSEVTVKLAVWPPKVTDVTVLKFNPLMHTVFPPATGPDTGLMQVITGADMVGDSLIKP
jgi:hypothetical protein